MFLLDSFYGVLASLGLWQKEANIKEANILFLGSRNARKTTLLHMLKDERLVQHQPTQYRPITEEFRIGRIKFKAFDWGGTETSLGVWQDCHFRVDAVVYLLDHRDVEESNTEWSAHEDLFMLRFREVAANVPFLMLVDGPDGALEHDLLEELRQFLYSSNSPIGLLSLLGLGNYDWQNEAHPGAKPVKLFECNIERETGYRDGFEWLSQYI